jgi:hypothetical protein
MNFVSVRIITAEALKKFEAVATAGDEQQRQAERLPAAFQRGEPSKRRAPTPAPEPPPLVPGMPAPN